MLTITNVVVLALVIAITALRLHRAGQARRSAEHDAATAAGDLEAIVDAAPAAIYVKDVDGRYRVANHRFCELFVPGGRRAVGKLDRDLYPPDTAPEHHARDAAVVSSGRAVESTETFEWEGGVRTYLALRFPLTEGDGVRAVCGIFTDITERTLSDQRERDLESRLARSERLESMGRLASGIAHDFNNLLSVILVTAELLVETAPPASQEREDVGVIADTARRAAALTQQLLIYARRSVGNPTAIDCNELVGEIGALLTRTIGEDLRLVVAPSVEPAIVTVDQVQLESVIMNLAVNARDATPSGGDLKISTDVIDADEDMLAGEGSGPGRYARITVADTGVGMEREVLLRAFEPFYTTKAEGTGTGLGLATVYGVVTGAGGFVRVYSEIGIGTTVRCYFPLSERPATVAARATGPEANRHRDATVLVVEDADDLRAAVVRLLTRSGFLTHAVGGIDDAFDYVVAGAGPVDLVLTDVIMPGGSGPELARRLAELRPELPVVFMSGYAGNALEQQGFDASQHTVVEKPFTRDSLVGAVTATLDAREVASTT